MPHSAALRTRVAAVRARAGVSDVAVALGCALAAVAGTVGADARWLPALGRAIVDRGGIPHGVPFAAAPSSGWHNVPVLAELILAGLNGAFGERGLLLAQVVAVAAALAILAADMRRAGAEDASAALVLVVIVVGALPALLVVRAQLFSLILFPALVALLRMDARTASARIWLLVPLVALWSNLHGAVLVGLAVAAAYLLVHRARREPLLALAVLVASALAVCATPAITKTPDYYLGVLRNEAARRGFGLWAPLSLTSGFDLVLVVAAIILLALALRSRPSAWEVVVLVVLVAVTVRVARNGVWLLFFAGPPAACDLPLRRRGRSRAAGLALGTAAVLVTYGLARGPLSTGATERLIDEALARAGRTPVLAQDVLAEQIALAGGRTWIGNPLDAFRRTDQRVYLDWLQGRDSGGLALQHAPRVVLVRRHTRTAKKMAAASTFAATASDGEAVLYIRRR